MAPENRDESIRKLFEELRAADRRLTPPFARVWQKAMALGIPPHRSIRVWMPAATVAVAVAAIAIATLIYLAPLSRHRAADNTSLAEWRSPTAYLLSYPGQEFYRDTSELNLPLEPHGQFGWGQAL